MIVDTSAIISILGNEIERPAFTEAIANTSYRGMSVANFVEASIVLESRHGYEGVRDLDLFIAKAEIALIPVDAEQAHVARRAFKTYGKGRHPAGLNFGDCFAYALAKVKDDALLFKGNGFSQTDVKIFNAQNAIY